MFISIRSLPSQVMIHPITHSSHSLLAHVKRREQDTSGYPNLSPVGVTLVHAIINIIYDIQDKEPWNKAISQVCIQYASIHYPNLYFSFEASLYTSFFIESQVVYSRLCEMDVFMQQLADIRASLDSSSSSRTAGTDSLLPQLASVLRNLQQVCKCLIAFFCCSCTLLYRLSLSLSLSLSLCLLLTGCVASTDSAGWP